jgi:predicted MFS family arabinose efflux permease
MSDILTINKPVGKRFIFSLSLAVFGTGMLDVLASLLLVDLGKTFLGSASTVSLAVVSQIVTISSIAAVIFGVLNGFLAARISHKTLLLFGALCIVVGSVGCFLAPSLLFMEIFYPFDGIGTIVVGAMAYTLIGEMIPLGKRPISIGWVTAGGLLSSAVGFAIAGYIAASAGWRFYLLWYALPMSLIALALAYISVPSGRLVLSASVEKSLFAGFKKVLLNKSAAACLFGNMMMTAAGIWSFYGATFWRTVFFIPVQTVGLITLVVVIVYAAGSVVGGRLVNTAGRKPLVVASWIARGSIIAAIVFMPSFWSAFAVSCAATFIGGIAVASSHCLNVEQVANSRGTMMSLAGVFVSVGASVGLAAASLALGMYGFRLVGVTLGAFGIISALIVLFLAKDPTKRMSPVAHSNG